MRTSGEKMRNGSKIRRRVSINITVEVVANGYIVRKNQDDSEGPFVFTSGDEVAAWFAAQVKNLGESLTGVSGDDFGL